MTLLKGRSALALALVALVAGLFGASAAQPSSAEAGVSVYCNNITLGGKQICDGAPRNMYAVEGWGDSTSACVFVGASFFLMCSGGPGQHVYSGFGCCVYHTPRISNNAWETPSVMHGRAYQP